MQIPTTIFKVLRSAHENRISSQVTKELLTAHQYTFFCLRRVMCLGEQFHTHVKFGYQNFVSRVVQIKQAKVGQI